MSDPILIEARRLHQLGFAIHWLQPNSKRPVESGWTTGPRKSWEELKRSYQKGMNVGVRLGTPSELSGRYLAVIDVDVKSGYPHHEREAVQTARAILNGHRCPVVRSGRGNGSRHYYLLTEAPLKGFDVATSTETVAVMMPSVKPSGKERKLLTPEELEKGLRLRPAWEVSLMSEGRQVVLPPSIHPDSGKAYHFSRDFRRANDIPVLTKLPERPKDKGAAGKSTESVNQVLQDFELSPVDLGWLPISDEIRDAIVHGKGVEDRSSYLVKASSALFSAGLSRNEVLTVLTDPETFLGGCAYDHAQSSSRKAAARWLYRYTAEKIEKERSPAAVFAAAPLPSTPRKLTPEEQAVQSAELKADRHWRQDIQNNKDGKPAKIVQNVVHIICNAVSPEIIRRDEFAYRDTYAVDSPWGAKQNEVVTDDDVSTIKYWLGCNYQFEPSKQCIEDALIVIARRNSYDPVRDALDALPAWDERPRLDTWLRENFEAKGHPEYLGQVFRKWMAAMVMRVYQPGSKFDWMPIFEGPQNVGKSSFGRILVGERYFLDWLPNLADKDAALALQGMWGVEMAELSQFRRSELESIKAFITRTVDKMRPPYGRRLIESPRRCVFFGTTNRATYLIDETGNRRFKPIMVGRLNFKALLRDRIQLFSEAKHLWKMGFEKEHSMELTGAAAIYERQIHHEKMVEDDSHSMEEAMRDFMEKARKSELGNTGFDFERFVILDLFRGVGPLGGWRPENRNLQFASKMLKRIGARERFLRGRKTWKIPLFSEIPDFF